MSQLKNPRDELAKTLASHASAQGNRLQSEQELAEVLKDPVVQSAVAQFGHQIKEPARNYRHMDVVAVECPSGTTPKTLRITPDTDVDALLDDNGRTRFAAEH